MLQQALNGKTTPQHTSQQMFLDLRGNIIESDDRLFPTLHLKNRPVTEWLPFIESILPIIADPAFGLHADITFPKVQPQCRPLPGIYDFNFIKAIWSGHHIIVWSITDLTDHYIEIGQHQQLRNQASIEQEQPNT